MNGYVAFDRQVLLRIRYEILSNFHGEIASDTVIHIIRRRLEQRIEYLFNNQQLVYTYTVKMSDDPVTAGIDFIQKPVPHNEECMRPLIFMEL